MDLRCFRNSSSYFTSRPARLLYNEAPGSNPPPTVPEPDQEEPMNFTEQELAAAGIKGREYLATLRSGVEAIPPVQLKALRGGLRERYGDAYEDLIPHERMQSYILYGKQEAGYQFDRRAQDPTFWQYVSEMYDAINSLPEHDLIAHALRAKYPGATIDERNHIGGCRSYADRFMGEERNAQGGQIEFWNGVVTEWDRYQRETGVAHQLPRENDKT